ncbi:phosphopantetheine-binding protein [Kibdelosporangium persicum]|uniref:Carrier domain-containing protein n=1 Tax=Kibdelosporangium persicum TaxID=2698649 RepID=A0ABX2F7Z2_9PSEU|nr:phosphopantetheine-binding protein [Kibdelosporangium persicum]NRN67036.1 Carrier domain-containing protein [Kibdelosporangium persicum]
MPRSDEIKAWIVRNFAPDVDPADLPDDYDLLASGLISSLSLVRLVSGLAAEFDVDIDAADLRPEYFRSVTSITEFVGAALQPQA